MEAVLQWGLDLIRAVQSFENPPLTAFMRIVTNLGSSGAYMILIPLVYWCINEKKGARLGITVLVSAWINISLKFALNQPRPFFAGYDPSVGMIPEQLGGFPSGHAQNALVIWMIIASWGRRKWLYAAAACICLVVSFSRIYLGVHFPTDILGGWIFGGLVLGVYFFVVREPEPWPGEEARRGGVLGALLEQGGFRAEMIAGAAAAFIMILYRPGDEALMLGGMLLGAAAGYSLNRRHTGFKSSAGVGSVGLARYGVLALRFALGAAGALVILAASARIIPSGRDSAYFPLGCFLRFAAAGLWVYWGAPWLFCRLRLAEGTKER
jgi:membrane-associated phospholipid phosphatase